MRHPPDHLMPASPWTRPASRSHSARAPLAQSALHLVLNRGSGSAEEDLATRLNRAVRAAGRPLVWHDASDGRTSEAAREAAQQAREDGGLVVAVGGDGTVSAVAHQAVRQEVPMAVVPAGTFNLFARAHAIPLDPDEAIAVALTGEMRPVSVGLLDERVFVVSASLGLHPELIAARELDTERFGRDRRVAWLSGLTRLWQMRTALSLRLEGEGVREQFRASTLLVSHNTAQLDTLGALPDAVPDHGLPALQVFVVPPLRGLQWLPVIWRALWGRLREAEGVQCHSLRQLTLHAPRGRRLRLAVDGELLEQDGPVTMKLLERGLGLMVARPEAGG